MTSRSITREYNDFLVQFEEDKSILVVPRSRILTDRRVRVGETHNTVWGQAHEFDLAVVLATGEWLDLTRQMNELKRKRDYDHPPEQCSIPASPDSIPSPVPESPTPPSTPIPKKRKVDKPDATLLDVGSPPPLNFTQRDEPAPHVTTPVVSIPATPNQTTPQSSYRSSIPIQMTTLNKKVDVLNKRILSVELAQQRTLQQMKEIEERSELRHQQTMTTLNTIIQLLKKNPEPAPIESSTPAPSTSRLTFDFPPPTVQPTHTRPQQDHFSYIDHPNRIAQEDLQHMYRDTQGNGAGNFSQHILRKLYPELFTRDHLRLKYSYYGGGKLEKTPLSPTRLDLVRQYVCVYYPELQNRTTYKDTVITKINECLRRPIDQKKKVCRNIDL